LTPNDISTTVNDVSKCLHYRTTPTEMRRQAFEKNIFIQATASATANSGDEEDNGRKGTQRPRDNQAEGEETNGIRDISPQLF
jgi:hypothetical protein